MTQGDISTDVDRAVSILRDGGVVAIPTETVYGLAACASNENAVAKIYETKGRPRSHPLIVHVDTLERAERWGIFNESSQTLANHFWPGPLTIVVQRQSFVPDWITGGHDTVAIRIPDHVVTLEVIEKLDEAIVAPSANRFGKVSPTRPEHVAHDLGTDVDLILDGGQCGIGIESTIVECNREIQILRPGAIDAIQISEVLQHSVSDVSGPSRAPGMMKSHYAPRAQVVLCDSYSDLLEKESDFVARQLTTYVINESRSSDLARNLYQRLRDADSLKCDVILVVRAPNEGIGVAINDRLEKAAADSSL